MKSLLPALLSALTFLTTAPPATAATPVPTVTYRVDAATLKGDSGIVQVRVIIAKGWHIQSDSPLDDFLIPTTVKAAGEGLRFGTPAFPKPRLKDFPALGGKVALFEDTVDVRLPVRTTREKAASKGLLSALEKAVVTLRYQACNDSQCLPPKEVTAKLVP